MYSEDREEEEEAAKTTVGRYTGQEDSTRRRDVERTRSIYCLVGHKEETDVFLQHEDLATGTK